MSWSRRLLLASALLAAGAVTLMVTRQRQLTPSELLGVYEARLARREQHSEEMLLRGFETVARLAAERGEGEVAARALVARGKLLLELGAGAGAREDFQRALREFRPGDLEIRRLAAQARIAAGEFEAALGDLDSLLAEVPEYAPAWAQAGELHRRLAAERVGRAEELLARAFTREAQERAGPLLARLCALDPGDARRPAIAARLRELGPYRESEPVARALGLADEAAHDSARARAAFTRNLELDPDPIAIAGLLRILIDAGELETASELGRLALRHPGVPTHLPTLDLLLRLYVERGDARAAAQVARSLLELPAVELEHLLLASRAFYETRDVQRLLGPTSSTMRLRQTSDRHTPVAELYTGLFVARTNDPARGMLSLRNFTNSTLEDPFPGARLLAWREVADAASRSGDRFGEREALHAAVQLAPEGDAGLWRRLYELQAGAEGSSSDLPLASLTQALRLDARLVAELLPTWTELGERSLVEAGIDLPSVFQGLRDRGQALPTRPLQPYALFRLAESWFEAGDPARARFVARRLLEVLPGFLPALDLYLDASLALGRTADVVEQVVRRAEAVGLDERTQALLDRVLPGDISSEQILRLVRAAPDRIGRRLFAERQRREGWPERALASLEAAGDPGDGRIQAAIAELLLEAGEYGRAASAASRVPAKGPAARAARRAGLLASLRQATLEDPHAWLDAAREAGSAAEWLDLAHLLAGLGEPSLARELLAPLDAPDGARGEPLFLSLAVVALLEDDLPAARVALARAEFFANSTRPSVGRLLLHVQDADWKGAARIAAELRSEERVPSRRDALLALLEERPEEGLRIAQALAGGEHADPLLEWVEGLARLALHGADEDPGDPLGLDRLALGTPEAPRDPRRLAALLLALDSPPFVPLARRELRTLLRANLARPRVLYLQARADLALGDRAAARRALETVLRAAPGLRAAWTDLGQLLAGSLASQHPDRVAFEGRRATFEAAGEEQRASTFLARAELYLTRGDGESALVAARRALELAPGASAALAAEAAALELLGDPIAALESRRRAVFAGAPEAGAEYVPTFLAALRAGLASRPPTLVRAQAELELERLRERFPDDPRVVLAQAQVELAGQETPSLAAWTRARARLAAFRERHAGRPLEELARGSAEGWVEILLTYDPAAALASAEYELRLDPTHLALHVLRARALRLERRLDEALELTRTLARMASDPRIEFERAACLVARAAPLHEIEAQISRARESREARGPLVELEILRARSRVQSGPEPRSQLLSDLERYWRAGPALLRQRGGEELAYLYALHLALGDPRSEPRGAVDLPLLRQVVGALQRPGADPYRAACARGFLGLASRAPTGD